MEASVPLFMLPQGSLCRKTSLPGKDNRPVQVEGSGSGLTAFRCRSTFASRDCFMSAYARTADGVSYTFPDLKTLLAHASLARAPEGL